jgi:hypothetical protein
MARGFKSPAAQVLLPKVSFVIVQDDDINQPAGVHDLQARSYGCMQRICSVKPLKLMPLQTTTLPNS